MSSSSRQKNVVTAFNMVPVVEQMPQDKQVECVAAYDKALYIGTTDGQILYYQLEENVTPLGKTVYQCKLRGRNQLDADRRKAVQQMTVVPSQRRLLVLIEGVLYLLEMYKLELCDPRERLLKISCYCVNEGRSQSSSSAAFEVVVAPLKRRVLQLYALSNDKFVHLKDYSVPDQPIVMARDGHTVCMAVQHGEGQYYLMNLADSGKLTDLPSFDSTAVPVIKRTNKDEFLINTGDLGVIVNVTGMSNRPPVEWLSRRPCAAAYMFPYVVTWSRDTSSIHVFSLADQRHVQEILFLKGKFLGQFHSKLYVAVDRGVYLLTPVPLKEQVEKLLNFHHLEEAILLAETIAAVEETKNPQKAEEYLNTVKHKAGFIFFQKGEFAHAKTLLIESGVDPRELICKFDNLLPSSSSFSPHPEIAADIPTAQTLVDAEFFTLKEARKFLIAYLQEVRGSILAIGRREDIDTALIKLLAQEKSRLLIGYISNHELLLNFDDTREALEKYHCHHALALLFIYDNQVEPALQIWTKIHDQVLMDKDFPGLDYIIEFLSNYSVCEVVLKYAKWALDANEVEGVKIFTTRPKDDPIKEKLSPNAVLKFLSGYPTATELYLEYLIFTNKLDKESYHTNLGMMYLERVLEIRDSGRVGKEAAARDKLKSFLETSVNYRASVLLNAIKDTDMFIEQTILFGRMEHHQKALTLLVHQLKDFSKAEKYCETYSKDRSRSYRQELYQTLLAIYLQPQDSSKQPLIKPALKLLNQHGGNFNAAEVLQLLPPQWPITTVQEFLMRSLRSSTHTSRTVKIERALARGENLQVRHKLMKLQTGPVEIKESKICPVCQLPFNDAAFLRYPNGTVTHMRCGRVRNICPITGTWFGE